VNIYIQQDGDSLPRGSLSCEMSANLGNDLFPWLSLAAVAKLFKVMLFEFEPFNWLESSLATLY